MTLCGLFINLFLPSTMDDDFPYIPCLMCYGYASNVCSKFCLLLVLLYEFLERMFVLEYNHRYVSHGAIVMIIPLLEITIKVFDF